MINITKNLVIFVISCHVLTLSVHELVAMVIVLSKQTSDKCFEHLEVNTLIES